MEYKDDLVIIGSGGHAKSVIDVAISQGKYNIVGCVSNDEINSNIVYGIKVIGSDNQLNDIYDNGIKNAFIAIGDNRIRKKLYNKVKEIGYNVVNIISPYAIISQTSNIGEGVCILHGALVHVDVVLGNNVIINSNATVDHDCFIGNNCHVAPGVAISGSVTINDGTHIGTGSSIIDGVKIGCWSYAGAGSVIVNDIEDYVQVYGVPAKVVRSIKLGEY